MPETTTAQGAQQWETELDDVIAELDAALAPGIAVMPPEVAFSISRCYDVLCEIRPGPPSSSTNPRTPTSAAQLADTVDAQRRRLLALASDAPRHVHLPVLVAISELARWSTEIDIVEAAIGWAGSRTARLVSPHRTPPRDGQPLS